MDHSSCVITTTAFASSNREPGILPRLSADCFESSTQLCKSQDEEDLSSVSSLSFSAVSLPRYHDLPANLSGFLRNFPAASGGNDAPTSPQLTTNGENIDADTNPESVSSDSSGVPSSSSTAAASKQRKITSGSGRQEAVEHFEYSSNISRSAKAAGATSYDRSEAAKLCSDQRFFLSSSSNYADTESRFSSSVYDESRANPASAGTHTGIHRESSNSLKKWKTFSDFQKKLDSKEVRLLDLSDSSSSSGWDSDEIAAAVKDGNPHRLVRVGTEEVTAMQYFERWLNSSDSLQNMLNSSDSDLERSVNASKEPQSEQHHLQHHRLPQLLASLSPETKSLKFTDAAAEVAVGKNMELGYSHSYSADISAAVAFLPANAHNQFATCSSSSRPLRVIKDVGGNSKFEQADDDNYDDESCSSISRNSRDSGDDLGCVSLSLNRDMASRRLLKLHFKDSVSPVKPVLAEDELVALCKDAVHYDTEQLGKDPANQASWPLSPLVPCSGLQEQMRLRRTAFSADQPQQTVSCLPVPANSYEEHRVFRQPLTLSSRLGNNQQQPFAESGSADKYQQEGQTISCISGRSEPKCVIRMERLISAAPQGDAANFLPIPDAASSAPVAASSTFEAERILETLHLQRPSANFSLSHDVSSNRSGNQFVTWKKLDTEVTTYACTLPPRRFFAASTALGSIERKETSQYQPVISNTTHCFGQMPSTYNLIMASENWNSDIPALKSQSTGVSQVGGALSCINAGDGKNLNGSSVLPGSIRDIDDRCTSPTRPAVFKYADQSTLPTNAANSGSVPSPAGALTDAELLRKFTLSARRIVFSVTEIFGQGSAKIQVQNRTAHDVQFNIVGINDPFRIRSDHRRLTCRAKHYLNVPVVFRPKHTGDFCCTFDVIIDSDEKVRSNSAVHQLNETESKNMLKHSAVLVGQSVALVDDDNMNAEPHHHHPSVVAGLSSVSTDVVKIPHAPQSVAKKSSLSDAGSTSSSAVLSRIVISNSRASTARNDCMAYSGSQNHALSMQDSYPLSQQQHPDAASSGGVVSRSSFSTTSRVTGTQTSAFAGRGRTIVASRRSSMLHQRSQNRSKLGSDAFSNSRQSGIGNFKV